MALRVDTGKEAELACAWPALAVRTVLLVLEDRLVRELLAAHLRAAACFPLAVAELAAARRLAAQVLPDAIVVDLPEGRAAALQWALELAHDPGGPRILTASLVASAAQAERDQGAGVDLHIEKPFEPRELVRQLLERMGPLHRSMRPAPVPACARNRCIELDPDQPTVRVLLVDGWHALDLPHNEHRLLAHLLSDPDRVHSREAIREAVWPDAAIDLRTVDQSVRRLRRSLSKVDAHHLVRTVNGVGYRVVPEVL